MSDRPRAVILAAGRGTRLRTRTADRPKCLVELAGRTLLDWQLAALLTACVAPPVTVVAGYRGDLVRDGRIVTVTNPRWAATTMVRSLLAAADVLASGPTIVSYADVVYHPDHVAALAATDADVAITWDTRWEELWQRRFADPLTDAETFAVDERGHVTTIGGRPRARAEVRGQFMGLLRWTPAGWSRTTRVLAQFAPAAVDALDMTTLLGHLITAGVPIAGIPVGGRWCEIDSEHDLALQERLLASGEAWAHDWRWDAQEA